MMFGESFTEPCSVSNSTSNFSYAILPSLIIRREQEELCPLPALFGRLEAVATARSLM